jgi:hypothetical protein
MDGIIGTTIIKIMIVIIKGIAIISIILPSYFTNLSKASPCNRKRLFSLILKISPHIFPYHKKSLMDIPRLNPYISSWSNPYMAAIGCY